MMYHDFYKVKSNMGNISGEIPHIQWGFLMYNAHNEIFRFGTQPVGDGLPSGLGVFENSPGWRLYKTYTLGLKIYLDGTKGVALKANSKVHPPPQFRTKPWDPADKQGQRFY